MNVSQLEAHCMLDHAIGLPPDQDYYLSWGFEPGHDVTWTQVHNNLHRLASKHGEPAHWEEVPE